MRHLVEHFQAMLEEDPLSEIKASQLNLSQIRLGRGREVQLKRGGGDSAEPLRRSEAAALSTTQDAQGAEDPVGWLGVEAGAPSRGRPGRRHARKPNWYWGVSHQPQF